MEQSKERSLGGNSKSIQCDAMIKIIPFVWRGTEMQRTLDL